MVVVYQALQHPPNIEGDKDFLELIFSMQCGDGNEVFIGLQKNDDSYGIPHGTLNKNKHQTSRIRHTYLNSAIKPT